MVVDHQQDKANERYLHKRGIVNVEIIQFNVDEQSKEGALKDGACHMNFAIINKTVICTG